MANATIAIIGLGYVGLPLAAAFGRHRPVIGYDINPARITALRAGRDATGELSKEELAEACELRLTCERTELTKASIYIVTVPTPVDARSRPNLGPLLEATQTIGSVLKPGDTVIYESTVYPGATEEDCVPLLERISGLNLNADFSVGYSPERINPGDRSLRLPNIVKITSGSNPEAARRIDALYASIVPAGTYSAESIRIAEAAKVIENTQRDLNIALVNELAIIFNRLGIDTEAVLKAAATKWNFQLFWPGLVGGHCVGVDPYYLTHRAEIAGYQPQVILAGRKINDGMGHYVAHRLVKALLKRDISVNGARILVLGLSFKENCADLRNTRVVDLIEELRDFGARVDVYDPLADPEIAQALYGLTPVAQPPQGAYDGVVIAVAHAAFRSAGTAWARSFGRPSHVLYDLKNVLPAADSDLRL